MGTIHANSAREALHRLETLALLAAGNLSEKALQKLISSCVEAVIFLERNSTGRKLISISEVKGVEGGVYQLKEWKQENS